MGLEYLFGAWKDGGVDCVVYVWGGGVVHEELV